MAGSIEFQAVFKELKGILQRRAGALSVGEDTETKFCLMGGRHPTHKTPMPIAWVQIGKNYVSFHHMGIYGCPQLLKGISRGLKARQQGKSCFGFKTVDEKLFAELEGLTVRGFEAFRKAGYMK